MSTSDVAMILATKIAIPVHNFLVCFLHRLNHFPFLLLLPPPSPPPSPPPLLVLLFRLLMLFSAFFRRSFYHFFFAFCRAETRKPKKITGRKSFDFLPCQHLFHLQNRPLYRMTFKVAKKTIYVKVTWSAPLINLSIYQKYFHHSFTKWTYFVDMFFFIIGRTNKVSAWYTTLLKENRKLQTKCYLCENFQNFYLFSWNLIIQNSLSHGWERVLCQGRRESAEIPDRQTNRSPFVTGAAFEQGEKLHRTPETKGIFFIARYRRNR